MASNWLTALHLLVVSQYFWPENFRINDLVAELVQRGHEVTVLTGKPNYPAGQVFPEFRQDPEKFNSYAGAAVLRVPMLARGSGHAGLLLNYLSFALSATCLGLLRLRKRRFDAIFVFEPSPVTVGLPAVALRATYGWPIAFWVLDQWPETLTAVGIIKSPFLTRSVGRLVSFIYRRCDLLLAQSRSMMSQIGKYTGREDRIVYFPSWAEQVYADTTSAPAQEVPLQNASFDILFAGNVGEAQDFPAILDAAEALQHQDHIRWLIVGDGRMSEWVKGEIARRGLHEKVLLLGRFPVERMPSFYKHADALLVSLKADPIFAMTVPGKVQSYLASGVPILGLLDGEGARVIEESGAGFVAPAGDAVKLAEIALRLSRLNVADRNALGKKGRCYSRIEFDRDALVAKLERCLAEIASAGIGQDLEAQ